MTSHYRLQVIRAEGIQWKSLLHRKDPRLYVEVKLDSAPSQKTNVVEKCVSPTWNETFIFAPCDESSTLKVQVKHKSKVCDRCVGAVNIKIADLLAKGADQEATFALSLSDRDAMTTMALPFIVLHLEVCDAKSATLTSTTSASEEVLRSNFQRLGASDVTQLTGDGVTSLESQNDLYKVVGELLSRLDVFKGIADALSEIHPFLTIAWSVASILYTAVKDVFETDQKVIKLVTAMTDAIPFVNDVEALREKSARLHESINRLLKQIIECCLFVRQYAQRSFFRRMLDLGSSQKVDEFEKALASFKQQIDSGVVLHTAFVSMRTSEQLNDLSLLQRLNPSLMDGFHRPECLPGTRTEIRAQIVDWVFSETNQNIFWLHGVAGSGKSTISTTIANELREMSKLGAYLFFERGKSEPSSAIRTIAYKLALFDSSIGSNILSAIENDKDIVSSSPQYQFNKLLLQPLLALENAPPAPVVIVLDALDECGTPATRRSLLELLHTGFPKLPSCFRFLITSRQEADISRVISLRSETVCEASLDHMSATSRNDVSLYLRTKMREVVEEQVEIPDDWPWEENITQLCTAAGGLFIWASTALRVIRDSDNPFDRLETLVSDSRSLSRFGLDELYATVLRNSGIDWENVKSRDRFRNVLSLLLLCKAPLRSKTIDGILGFASREPCLLILSKLRSLITYSPGGPVSLLHASFSDYLTSPDRAHDPWFIDMGRAKYRVAYRCFTVMEDLLHFNICDLESSFVYNNDITGLGDRVKTRIPSHLEYACIYWTGHLIAAPYASELRKKLLGFAYHRLLFWFEVLSLVRVFNRIAHHALLEAASWCDPHDTDIAAFLRDASKLAAIFAPPIMQSTPHIYVTMIPLSEDNSPVARHYSKCMTSLAGVERTGVKRPPLCLKVLEGHSDPVKCVAFSPNGRHVASASCDETVRVWDIYSGEEIFMPLAGHTGEVTSVCFSPDGSRVVSGSWDCTLRIWDARSGHAILGPLGLHDRVIWTVAWSPDGMMIASGSGDRTIIIWDATEGRAIRSLEGNEDDYTQVDVDDPEVDPFKSVTCVAFSPDSTQLVSGSIHGTIRIWDVKSGELAFEPFKGHSSSVQSIAFSPDGTRVVSGSEEGTVKLWGVESGRVASRWKVHTPFVTSVAYSPCGNRVASGTMYKMISVWDVKSGKMISALDGHTKDVSSVAFSPDGKYIASGSDDNTVRIWDATAANDSSESSVKHSTSVISIAYSPDGGRIASGSWDESIIVWNAQTGNVVLGPLIGHTRPVSFLAFSQDGSRLFSGSYDGTTRMWDARTGVMASDLLVRSGSGVEYIAVSPDGTTVVSGAYNDDTIGIWSVATGRLASIGGHLKSVRALAFSPNGKHLASGSEDTTIKIWNTENWEAMHGPLIGHTRWVNSVCFSSDGRLLVSGSWDKTVIIWDVMEHRKIAGPLEGHESFVNSVLFSRDGKHVISGSEDNIIRIWSLESEQTVCELEGHTGGVRTIALSSDGCRIVSGSYDRTIRMWDLSDLLVPLGRDTDNSALTFALSSISSNWILGENGWVLGGPDRRDLLLWIPPDLRATLWRPRTTAVLGCDFSTKLDFTGAALGKNWTDCFRMPGRY